jgi:hypothetical protein
MRRCGEVSHIFRQSRDILAIVKLLTKNDAGLIAIAPCIKITLVAVVSTWEAKHV